MPRHPAKPAAEPRQPDRRQQDAQQEEPPGKLQRRRLLPRPDARAVLLRQRHPARARPGRGLVLAHPHPHLAFIAQLDDIPEDLRELSSTLVDFYYGNFSLFQSLPDSWAIDQLFPVMPIHRLDEKPRQRAVLADITCDCDGKIDRFIDKEDVAKILPLHDQTRRTLLRRRVPRRSLSGNPRRPPQPVRRYQRRRRATWKKASRFTPTRSRATPWPTCSPTWNTIRRNSFPNSATSPRRRSTTAASRPRNAARSSTSTAPASGLYLFRV
jgi:hypothetical protein